MGKAVISRSKRYEWQYFVYWWDIWPSRIQALSKAGEIVFVEKDTGTGYAVRADDLLPLLTEERRTSRMRAKNGGNWGVRILAAKPGLLVIEQPRLAAESWPRIPARRA